MLSQELKKAAANFDGTRKEVVGPSGSFISFITERASDMAANGSINMGIDIAHLPWSIDRIRASFEIIRQYGLDIGIRDLGPNAPGQSGLVLTVRWE